MVRHMVLTKFKATVTEDTIAGIYQNAATLIEGLDNASGFVGGRSQSPEQIERGYMHAFTADFSDWHALSEYAAHPDHAPISNALLENAEGGLDGILVVDIEV
jgi:hypothetical protein